MNHNEVYRQFEKMFPQHAACTEKWFQNGKNSVRVRISGGSDFVFTYHNWLDWRFETVESYLKSMRGKENKK